MVNILSHLYRHPCNHQPVGLKIVQEGMSYMSITKHNIYLQYI